MWLALRRPGRAGRIGRKRWIALALLLLTLLPVHQSLRAPGELVPREPTVVRAAIAIAQEMGMYVVAEAVETEGEAKWLREAGVGCMQGYLFGPPTVTPDFRAFRHGRPSLADPPG